MVREKEEKKAFEERKKSTPPELYFKEFESDKWTFFDEAGIPTHD